MINFERWKPTGERSLEDNLLHKYWLEAGGLIFTEVSVGGKGPGNIFPEYYKPMPTEFTVIGD